MQVSEFEEEYLPAEIKEGFGKHSQVVSIGWPFHSTDRKIQGRSHDAMKMCPQIMCPQTKSLGCSVLWKMRPHVHRFPGQYVLRSYF